MKTPQFLSPVINGCAAVNRGCQIVALRVALETAQLVLPSSKTENPGKKKDPQGEVLRLAQLSSGQASGVKQRPKGAPTLETRPPKRSAFRSPGTHAPAKANVSYRQNNIPTNF